MKFKIENIEELSDSRQVMESKPNKFIYFFIGLVLLGLIISFLFLFYGNKEEVITVSGVITLKEKSQVVSNEINGIVKEFNVKNGQNIKQEDLIYTLDDTEFLIQKDSLENQKQKLINQNIKLDKFVKSINDGVNYFKQNEEEREFYYKYKAYESQHLESGSDKEGLLTSKNSISNQINDLNKFKKSVEENNDYTNNGSIYTEHYNNYRISKKLIDDKINELNKKLSEVESNEEGKDAVEQIFNEIKNNEVSLEKLKSDTIMQIDSSINELNSQIKIIDSNIKNINESSIIVKEKNKITMLAQIEEEKSLNNTKIEELDINIKDINTNIEKCYIKADIDGVLDIKSELQPGMVVQSGFLVGEIINDQDNLQVELIIPDKDIGVLKINQDIKYNISSFPHTEFGFIKGKIENLSISSSMDETTGSVYYKGIGSLEKNYVENYNNEKFYIKNGMTCEVKIITDEKKLLYYVLEKLNIKTGK